MKKHLNFVTYLIVSLLFVGAVNAQEGSVNGITQQDVRYLRQQLLQGKDILKEDGYFINLKEMEALNKEEMLKRIKKYGMSSLFPDRYAYNYFLRYLNHIANSRELVNSIGKLVSYKDHSNLEYYYILEDNDGFSVIINVLNSSNIYFEQSFIYSFEKVDGTIVLSKMMVDR